MPATPGLEERLLDHCYDIVRFDQVQNGRDFADKGRRDPSDLPSMREVVQAPIRERRHICLLA
jgi:hypothetical protein